MRATADANVLVRFVVNDGDPQCAIARQAIESAEAVVLPISALCELVWVLRRIYRFERSDIADALHRLFASADLVLDRPLAEAGLAWLEAGGDFADGVIEFEGRKLGSDIFLTFDRQAAGLLEKQGGKVRLLR